MEPIKLKQLIQNIPSLTIKGSKDVVIQGLSNDSRKVAPNDLFIARKTEHAKQAVENGASAVLSDIYNPFLSVSQVIVEDVEEIEALIAKKFYRHPFKELFMIGITGTNGKTTTTFMCRQILQSADILCGIIGTTGYYIGNQIYDPILTTPDVVMCHKLLKEMVTARFSACAMEVSSHALVQNRIKNIDFDVAIFTNITDEHLDYHKDMTSYALAKQKLFTSLKRKSFALINQDAAYAEMMKETAATVITFGIEKPCDIRAKDITISLKGSSFILHYQNQKYRFSTPLIGKFNVYNLLAAISMALIKGIDISLIQKAVASMPYIIGRMEKIASHPHIFVDYAHTPDGLEQVLTTLSTVKKNRIITLFGCGGDRDPFKRDKMASIAEKYSDHTIVTSDNPRTEDPQKIIDEIARGFSGNSYSKQVDRKKAIEEAIIQAEKEDIVLIAGKGHEKVQIFAHTTLPFNDAMVAKEVIKKR